MSNTRTQRLPILVTLVASGAVLAAAAGGSPQQAAGTASRPVTGFAMPSRVVTISAPIDGTLAVLAVAEGDEVAHGDLLLSMDDQIARAAVAAARVRAEATGEIERARVAVERSGTTLHRVQSLGTAASTAEVEDAAFDLQAAEANLRAAQDVRALAQASLAHEQARLAEHHVPAPFDGIVTRISVDAGASLESSSAILELVSIDRLHADLYLPSTQWSGMRPGTWVKLQAGSPVNDVVPAMLRSVDRVFDPASQTVRCVFEIANPDGTMPAGFPVRLDAGAIVSAGMSGNDAMPR